MSLNLAYDLANYTPADANPVQSNFQRTEQHINQELINRDGSVAMTGQLKLVANPVAPLDAASKQYVDLILPIGVMFPYPAPGSAPGAGVWALANGAELQTADYPELFEKYQYSWGGVAGGGSFFLPNMAGRVPVGAGGTLGGAVGNYGGNKDAVVVSHVHNARHAHTASSDVKDLNHYHTQRNHTHGGRTGDGGAHDHGWGQEQFLYNSSVPSGYGLSTNGNIRSAYWSPAGHHQHDFGTGGPSDPNVSWWHEVPDTTIAGRATHGHTITVNENSFDTQPTGVAAANANMPPYAVMQWIVRVR